MKRLLLTLSLILALVFTLAACNGGDNNVGEGSGNDNNDGSDAGGPEENEGEQDTDEYVGAIFSPKTETYVVKSSLQPLDLLPLIERICDLTGKIPMLIGDDHSEKAHEIVIGDTERDISQRAIKLMEYRKEDDNADKLTSYYCIYSDGDSVAFVFSDEYAYEEGMDYFMKNYVYSKSLALSAGHADIKAFSRLDKMRVDESEEREAKYREIEETFGKDVVSALRKHFSIYDERFYLWLSDLYEPGEYDEDGNPLGGGFYYSNSARNTPGYLIDIESTQQALSFLTGAGMLRGYGNSIDKAIPERMKNELIAFALSLQSSEDGYFYHPQWGKNISTGRLSRDTGWATSLLKSFGKQPYWNAPNGTEGLYGEPGLSRASDLTDRLSEKSTVVAVSDVIDVAANNNKWPERLRTLENWRTYLASFEDTIHTKSYSIGHEVAEQSAQIKNRDKEALENGEETGYVALAAEFFNSWQNPENGLWESSVNYNSINGLMKIMALYNSLEIKLNYAEKAFACAVEIICLEGLDENGKGATNSVDVYNPWISITRINTNITKYGSPETVAVLRRSLQENAAEMIRITTAKTEKFKKEDGSFGYTQSYSPAKSQGAPVAVPDTVEGDINGGTIALTGVTGNMLSALGISGLYIYYPSDFEVFIERAMGHTTALKGVVDIMSNSYDFEEEAEGELFPSGVSLSLTDGDVSVESESDGNLALRFNTVKDKGDAFSIAPFGEFSTKKCYILEWDMRFTRIGASTGTAMQIKVGNAYMLTIGINTAGTVTFGDSSATSSAAITNRFNGTFDAYSTHKVRIEYYRGDTPVTLVYVDDTLIAESYNYYGSELGAASDVKYDKANFYALFSTDCTVFFDNILLDVSDKEFGSEIEDDEPYLGEFDFEDSELGEPMLGGLTTTPNPEEGNSIVVAADPKNSENKALKITARKSSKAGNWSIFTAADGEGDVCLFETDFLVGAHNNQKDIIQLFFKDKLGSTVFSLNMTVVYSSGGYSLLFGEKTADDSIRDIFARCDDTIDGWVRIGISYNGESGEATVYLNGEKIGSTDAYYSEANKSKEIDSVSFYTTFSTDSEIYLDNVSVKK